MQDKELWDRIKSYRFPVGFDLKLAEEFRAKPAQVLDLREEYLRFVYLAQVSGAEVTPSQEVDRVWHLHLSYTRDYWDNFCANVLKKPFHHDPCESPASMPRYQQQYAKTRNLYQAEFGHPPPAQVWPTKASQRLVSLGLTIAVLCLFFGSAMFFLGPKQPLFYVLPIVGFAAGAISAVQSSPFDSKIRDTSKGSGNSGPAGGCSSGCGGGGCGGG